MKNRAIIYLAAAATIIILLSCLANYITVPPSWFQLSIFAIGWGLAAWLIILGTKEVPEHWNLGRQVSSPQMYASSRGQVDFLLFLRFFAALLVFLMHSGIVYKTSFADQLGIYSWLIFSPAWLGMEIFFTLSGYLMGKAFCVGRYKLTPVGIAEFIDLRVKRLLPLMIFVFVAVHSLASQALPLPNLGALVLFFFNGTYGGEQGLGAFWSLSTEFQFYMIMPILFGLFHWKITSRRASLAFAIILLILSLAVRFSFFAAKGMSAWSEDLWHPMYGHLDCFALGMLANWWIKWCPLSVKKISRTWPLVLIALYLVYAAISFPVMSSGGGPLIPWIEKDIYSGLFVVLGPTTGAVLTSLLIILIETRPVISNTRDFSDRAKKLNKVLLLAGGITYPFYLIHSPLLIWIQSIFPDLSYIPKLTIGFAATTALSTLIYLFVEPLLKKYWKLTLFRSFSKTS